MYVAMTRAGKRLYLTHSAFKYEYGSQKPIRQKPSPFLGEIPDNYKTVMIQTGLSRYSPGGNIQHEYFKTI